MELIVVVEMMDANEYEVESVEPIPMKEMVMHDDNMIVALRNCSNQLSNISSEKSTEMIVIVDVLSLSLAFLIRSVNKTTPNNQQIINTRTYHQLIFYSYIQIEKNIV
jgi:hypothetical protein